MSTKAVLRQLVMGNPNQFLSTYNNYSYKFKLQNKMNNLFFTKLEITKILSKTSTAVHGI